MKSKTVIPIVLALAIIIGYVVWNRNRVKYKKPIEYKGYTILQTGPANFSYSGPSGGAEISTRSLDFVKAHIDSDIAQTAQPSDITAIDAATAAAARS